MDLYVYAKSKKALKMIVGWYVLSAAGEQVAWHKTRAGARKLAVQYSERLGGVFYTHPEYV